MSLEDYVKQWTEKVKRENATRTEAIANKIYEEAKDLAMASREVRSAESNFTQRTGKLLRSISKRTIIEPDGSVAFEIYYDKNICSYANYIENGTRRIKPHKILARAFDKILSGG
jgi:HK97 gp10 family phage protein